MSYSSGEFPISELGKGDVWSAAQSAAAIFNETIFVIRPRDLPEPWNHQFQYYTTVTTFDLKNLTRTDATAGTDPIDGDALIEPKNWTTQSSNLPRTLTKPALVATPSLMCAILNPAWNKYGPSLPFPRFLSASTYRRPQNPSLPGDFDDLVALMETDGQTLPIPAEYSDVAATVVGENIIIVTCPQTTSASSPESGIFVGIYDTRDIDRHKKTWAAEWHTYLPYRGQVDPAQTSILTEWYSIGGQADQGPIFYLSILVTYPQNSTDFKGMFDLNRTICVTLPMTISERAGATAVTLKMLPSADWYEVSDLFGWLKGGPGMSCPASMMRDPGGRLRIWATPWNSQYNLVVALRASTTGTLGLKVPLPPFAPMSSIGYTSEILPVTDAHFALSSLFYINKSGRSEITVSGKPAFEYPVYEFIFYGRVSLLCQVVRCGTVQVIPDFSQPVPKQPLIPLNIIAGIIDGPVPLPLENYKEHELGSDTIEGCSITYGTKQTEIAERKVSDVWSLGFESSGEVTSGIGPAWDIAFSGGTGVVVGSSKETSRSYNLEQGASIEMHKGEADLDPAGSLRKVAAQFSITAFKYIDEFGPAVDSTTADPADAPKSASVLTTMVEPGLLDFLPFMVVPGDLMSYTPEAINARMRSLGYQGDNYFGDVICQNAYPFGEPRRPYLNYSFSPSSKSGEAFNEFQSSYQENSWHLDLKAYAGISGGLNIFGLVEAESKLIGGATYQHEASVTENKQSEWGIELGLEGWVLPEGKTDGSVALYDFRVFFLPVPSSPSTLSNTYWTEELIKYMPEGSETKPQDIDPNSGCWRLTYAVTKIQYKDEQKYPTYNYDGSLDKPSVYQAENR